MEPGIAARIPRLALRVAVVVDVGDFEGVVKWRKGVGRVVGWWEAEARLVAGRVLKVMGKWAEVVVEGEGVPAGVLACEELVMNSG